MAEQRQEPLPSVSVVMPTRDRAQLLERALEAVLADEATTEAIVVVDGSDPETRRLLDRLADRDRRIRVTNTPDHPARLHRVQRGRDHGVSVASSEVILSIDDDVVAEAGLVSGHARWHAGPDRIVVVGYMPVVTPRRWPFTHSPISYYAGAYESMCEEFSSDPDSILHKLWGGNVSVRRSDWLKAIKHPRVGTNLDDKELGLLLLRDGLRAVFDPKLRADHWYERSLRGTIDRAAKNVAGQAQLREVHRDVLGELPPAPPPSAAMRLLLRISRRSPGWFVVKWGLIGLTAAAAVLRLSGLEDNGTVAVSWLAWARAEAALLAPQAEALR